MKPTTPAMKTINGKKCVRLIDLAKAWDTTTSNILCTSKPYHIPEKYLHRVDGRVWCDVEGLRYRSTATSKSRLTRHICEFLDSLETPTEPTSEPAATTEPAETGSRTAGLVADAHQLAADSFLKASDNSEKLREVDDMAWNALGLAKENSARLDQLGNTVNKLKPCRDHVERHQSASATVVSDKNTARVQELSGKLDGLADAVHGNQMGITDNAADIHVVKQTVNTALDTATQAADLAQDNADTICDQMDRLTKLSERVGKLEEKANPPAVRTEGEQVAKHDRHGIILTILQRVLLSFVFIGTIATGVIVTCARR